MLRTIMMASIVFAAPALADEGVTLTPGPGMEAATTTCSLCHSLSYVVMNSVFLTSEQWRAEVTKMRQAFGAPMDDETAAEIVKYLTVYYGVPSKS